MMMEWEQLGSTVLGGSIAAMIAKYFISSTIQKVETLPEKLSEIKSQLSSMQVKMELLDRAQSLIQEHDRKIAILESRDQNQRGNYPWT